MNNNSKNKNLIILRAGDASLHSTWISGAKCNFDIYISYYGNTENKYQGDATFYEMRKGPKWPIIGKIFQENPELAKSYDAFWFPDDDLDATPATINQMFDYFHAFKLDLAQPALTRDSYYSWEVLLQQHEYILRFSKFVEVMAPIFNATSLQACVETFSESQSGWGLDWLWPELCGRGRKTAIAIIDATPVKHTRPLGGNLYKNNPNIQPENDAQLIIEKYQLQKQRVTNTHDFYGGIRFIAPSFLEQIKIKLRKKRALRRLKRQMRKGQ